MDEQPLVQNVAITSAVTLELHRYLADEQNVVCLYGILRSYIKRARIGPANDEAERDATYELLQDLVIKAHDLAEKYHGVGLQAWLLCIARNLIMQKREKLATRNKHEFSTHMKPDTSLLEEVEEVFDYLIMPGNLEQNVSMRVQFDAAFACLSPDDQTILNLSKYYGYNHKEVARILKITEVAARVRTMRALNRFRDAWNAQEGGKRGESDA
jgi:RNA polymerase sigma factor (sigma-70 family)